MNKIFNLLSYYILLLLGLIGTSWIIWSRFIRERTIRNIPDELLTEYRVWILLYLCCIYFIIIKNYIKESKSNTILTTISETINTYFWKPLITLDHFIKYNIYCKNYYYIFMTNFMKLWDTIFTIHGKSIIISLYIIPRIILIAFLILDTFYFNKLEIFYKVVLIGILPFIFKYIEYSFKDFYVKKGEGIHFKNIPFSRKL